VNVIVECENGMWKCTVELVSPPDAGCIDSVTDSFIGFVPASLNECPVCKVFTCDNTTDNNCIGDSVTVTIT
jgi:hypothetical protein